MERSGNEQLEPAESPQTMGLILAALFALGAFSGALTLILPHSPRADEAALWTNVGVAFLAASSLALVAQYMRPWMFHIALAAGTLTITRAVYLSHDAGGFYSLWYVWVGLYAFFFFGRRWGLIQLALVAVSFGFVLTRLPPSSSVVRWLMTVATIIIAGALVDTLTRRVRSREASARFRARSLEIVSDAAHALAREHTSASVVAAICRAAVEAAGAHTATVWLPTSDGRGLAAEGSSEPAATPKVVPFIEAGSRIVEAFVSGQRRQAAADGGEGRSCLLEPMVLDGVPTGVLAIDWGDTPVALDPQLDQVVALLALEGALALQRAATLSRLERVARTDDLTGLANRRAFDEHFDREIARATRSGTTLAIALLDLDHFKDFNDEHGHPAGDRLLKQVAANWALTVRATDILARYGGEEFALLLPGIAAEEAHATLERLRTEMPATQRVSAGLVFWTPGEQGPEALARADKALYDAKAQGRDRVEVA
jgi:diguanylate cyclase (GGDEF)-like protein